MPPHGGFFDVPLLQNYGIFISTTEGKMKKPLILITALITASAAFAQNAKSAGVTKEDVQSWIKNQKQIEQSLNEAGISRDNIADAGKQEKAKAESILQKYGITAPNSIEKYAMINQCATLVLAENGAGSGIDPNTMAMLKKMNVDPFAELRANTNQKDCKVVKTNEKAIVNLMKEMDQTNAGRASNASASAPQTANTEAPSTSNATKSGGAKNRDAAYAQAEQMRIANPEMTEEMVEQMAQKIRNQPGYAMQQAAWAMQQQGLASETQESAQNAEAQFKELNEKATKVKNAINEFTNSKGDCGFIYKNADKTAKAYTKKEPANWESLMIHVQDNVALLLPVTTKGKVEFKFTWDEPKMKKIAVGNTGYATSDVETTEMSKTVPVTITNIEMYESSDKNSTAIEYVISTKEGKVIHLWQKWSGDNWTTKVNFNGLKDASTWKWGGTGGN